MLMVMPLNMFASDAVDFILSIPSGLSDDEIGNTKSPRGTTSTNTSTSKRNKNPASTSTVFGEDVIPSQKATSALDNLLNGSASSSTKKKPTMLEQMMAGGGGSSVEKNKKRTERGWFNYFKKKSLSFCWSLLILFLNRFLFINFWIILLDIDLNFLVLVKFSWNFLGDF